MTISEAKHIAVGFLALLLVPVWFPLLIIGMFIDLIKRTGEEVCNWLERKQ